ncbi:MULTISPECIES: hypothetical protein [Fictibacillus]|uniref:YxiS n=1 Tax=Fictibacillus enclensis TaxID=1017270 RepID=A0A0V8JEG9_9BACL|nr:MULTISPECIES: hypothetical protein [Fictibacillus]KSU85281.1 hypothetical protein AS030_07170 [Fictibacillus enclensis]MDM5199120.1 hypothetical protein [Fictibacillus enclensis]RXY99053.1 hypothetical protein DMO16_04830 [Fictibacillus sp. S7]WHY74673.1 hypothetical protein QNH15_12530 [Fictibacillus enclensis]SCB94310.1 hypothetical protein GA0061096_1506 [Fictibacillus enclensis]
MDPKDLEQQIIQNYKQDEGMMILVFAQWCINHDIDPKALYFRAYPSQQENERLNHMLEQTVSKQESEEIADESVLGVLSLFGNEDLAFEVMKEIERRSKP